MTAFRKSFRLFAAAAVVTMAASPAFANISAINKLDTRAMGALIAPFSGLQEEARMKRAPVPASKAGVFSSRHASLGLTYAAVETQEAGASGARYAKMAPQSDGTTGRYYADAIGTMVQYADASQANT